MFVSDWMTQKVYTVSPEDSIIAAIKLIKEKGIRHVPVLKDERLKGIVSDRDIKEFMPSKATSLDVYELNFLIVQTKVKEIMKNKVITTAPDTPIEEAALTMYDNTIGCLPVLDNGRVTGIICDKDIFRALIDITGVRHNGHRIFLAIDDRPGSIKEVTDIVRKHGFHLQSILTSYQKAAKGYRHIVVRTKGDGKFASLKAELTGSFRNVRILKG